MKSTNSKKESDFTRKGSEEKLQNVINVLKKQGYKEEDILNLVKLTDAIGLLKKEGYRDEDILNLVKTPKEGIPVTIFSNDELSCLESIVKFLKENKQLSFSEIASLLNRDQRTIWTTYSNAKKKKKDFFIISETENYIPFEIFIDRNLGVLENICLYLKDVSKLKFHEIAVLLRRDDRTIWTSYHKARGKKKK